MTFEFDAPEEIGGGFVDVSGKAHCLVVETKDTVYKNNGGTLNCFEIVYEVVTGTAGLNKGDRAAIRYWNPKPDTSDKGKKFLRQKQLQAFLALHLMQPDQLGKRLSINLESAVGSQCFVQFKVSEREEAGKTYTDTDVVKIFHPDDPAAAKLPRNQGVLDSRDVEHRRDPSSFAGHQAQNTEEKAAQTTSVDDL